ncbi:SAM-dependent methyltransferase [Alphaproteobacteria bacterium]|nr:SAM-dependent methyltransferase [Alphaproteobacteria bacterium]
MSIQEEINKIIKNLQKISMQDFVQISNFEKKLGFYNREEENKIGVKGHFITSPEISSIFGMAMCNQFINKNPKVTKVHLLELGPGNGHLTSDILEEMNIHKIEVLSTTLLEKSEYFKKKQIKKFSKVKNFAVISNIEEYYQSENDLVFVYSNEFLDTFGHKQYMHKNSQFYEVFVTIQKNQYLLTLENSIHSEYIEKDYSYLDFKDGDILEHSPLIDFFIESLNRNIKKYFFTTCDYGYTEYSKKSTLRALRDHKKIDLFEFFEEVDYSFSVDFKRLTKLFEPNKSEIQSQSSFIKKYTSNFFNKKTSDETDIIKNLLTGTKDNEMGLIFKNFNSKNYD